MSANAPVAVVPTSRGHRARPAGRPSYRARTIAPEAIDRFYTVARAIARFWMWFFFERVDVRHPERVPPTGPVLLCVNHPNNLIDSLLVGSVLPRKVHYLATASLFRKPLVARFLVAAGAIPVYRKVDDPDQMDRNRETFAACHQAFDGGRLVAIYPEGSTHAKARVQRIKTGAARIALGYEAQAEGRLMLVPVGLTFEAGKRFRGRVLVSFGEAVPLSPYLAVYREEPAKALHALTTAVQGAMERELVHIESIDTAGLARTVEEINRGELERELWGERGVSEPQIDPARLSRSIVGLVEYFRQRDPERVERLWQRIQGYHAVLAAYQLRDEAARARPEHAPAPRRVARPWQAIAGLPLFAYGAVVNFLPYYVPRWLAPRIARRETDDATIRLLASVVAFPLFWALETLLVGRAVGLPWALAFLVSLPLGGLIAYRHLGGTGRLLRQLRFGALLLTPAQEARRLLAERREIIDELERATRDCRAATKESRASEGTTWNP